MESISPSMDPRDAGSQLAAAEALRSQLTGGLRLPTWFHSSIGAAVAIQIGTAAMVPAGPGPGLTGIVVLIAGVAVFVVVAAVQLLRFRRLNGVWIGGLASRAVLGTATLSSAVYAASLAAAFWAGLAGLWWLSVLAAAAGGAGYALSGRRWWAAYQRDPVTNAQGESPVYVTGIVVLAIAALVVLMVGRG
jgi:hypothetical protein